ncbi:MAG TPA: hypothetical protein VIT63_07905 [Nitrospira sp.]
MPTSIRTTPTNAGSSPREGTGLCLSPCLLYNRLMAFDPANPPIWLRKLHVTAAQINPTDYPSSAVEGILAVCRLSNAQYRWISALRGAVEESDRGRMTVLHS